MTDISREDALVHFGVKGMKWGVRKERSKSSSESSKPESGRKLSSETKTRMKKAAVISGTLLLAAGAVYAGYTLNKNGTLPISSLKKSKELTVGAKAAEKIVQEPTSIIYGTRTKHHGFTFLQKGGMKDPLSLFEQGFGRDANHMEFFERSGDKVFASFADPKGRKDHAGRLIPHMLIIPSPRAEGLNSLDDVRSKIWPTLEQTYQEFWDATFDPEWNR